ncbi:MAG TPA: GNAT family protein [Casimicrobiaceae bacterium]|jgi:ribosomal protein S18 acetylase RimI-like enzyme
MGEVVIRPMTLADVDQFNRITDIVFREREYMAFVEGFPLDECAAFVARNVRLRNPQLVADDDGSIVGWVDIQRETRPVHAHVGHLGIGVLPGYRGRGIGERLMRAALEAARAAGFERVELNVYGRNKRARALYRKLGFVHEGTRVRAKKIDGRYDDVHIMGILL